MSPICLDMASASCPKPCQAAPDPATARHVADDIRRLTLVQEKLAYKVCSRPFQHVCVRRAREIGGEGGCCLKSRPHERRPHSAAKTKGSYHHLFKSVDSFSSTTYITFSASFVLGIVQAHVCSHEKLPLQMVEAKYAARPGHNLPAPFSSRMHTAVYSKHLKSAV